MPLRLYSRILPFAVTVPLLAACSRGLPNSSGGSANREAAAEIHPPAQLGLCAACHGSDGIARQAGIPNLAGQHEAYLFQAMREYKSGTRNVALMRSALGPIDGQQMRALAHWYAAQPPCPESMATK